MMELVYRIKMLQYLILGLCLMTDIAWLREQCEERPLNVVLDSTNLTTRRHFDVFIDIMKNVTSRLQEAYNTSKNVAINLYSYNNNNACPMIQGNCVKQSINSSKVYNVSTASLEIGSNTGNLSSLRYRKHESQPFCLTCAEYLLKEHLMKPRGNRSFGLILTVYRSLKKYINRMLYPKYKKNITYVLVVSYNSTNNGADKKSQQPRVFARRIEKRDELVEIILARICPQKFKYTREKFSRRPVIISISSSATSTVSASASEVKLNAGAKTVDANKSTEETASLVTVKDNISESASKSDVYNIMTAVITSRRRDIIVPSLSTFPIYSTTAHSNGTGLKEKLFTVPIPTAKASYYLEIGEISEFTSVAPSMEDDTQLRNYGRNYSTFNAAPLESSIDLKAGINISDTVKKLEIMKSTEMYVDGNSTSSILKKLEVPRSTEIKVNSSNNATSSILIKLKVPRSTEIDINSNSTSSTLKQLENPRSTERYVEINPTSSSYVLHVTTFKMKYSKNSTNKSFVVNPTVAISDQSSNYSALIPSSGKNNSGNSSKVTVLTPSKSTRIFKNSSNVVIVESCPNCKNVINLTVFNSSVPTRLDKMNSILPSVVSIQGKEYFENSTVILIVKPTISTKTLKKQTVTNSTVPGRRKEQVDNSTVVSSVKPSKYVGLSASSSNYSIVEHGGITKYTLISTKVLSLNPKSEISMNSSYIKPQPTESSVYFGNFTKRPAASTEQYSSSPTVVASRVGVPVTNSTNVLSLNISKSIQINRTYSAVLTSTMDLKILKRIVNSTQALIVEPSMSTQISKMAINSSLAVAVEKTKYKVNSTVLVEASWKAINSSLVAPVEKANRTINSTGVLTGGPLKSTAVSRKASNHSSIEPKIKPPYLINSTNVFITKTPNSTTLDPVAPSSSSVVEFTSTAYAVKSTAVLVIKPSKSTEVFARYQVNSTVSDEKIKRSKNSTLFYVEVTKTSRQYPSIQSSVLSDKSSQSTENIPSTASMIPSEMLQFTRFPSSQTILSSNIINTALSPTFMLSVFPTSSIDAESSLSFPMLGVTQILSTASLQSSASSVIASSSVLIVPIFKKVMDDITYFMQQNITKLHMKQKLWVNNFIMNTSTLLNEIEREEDNDVIQEKSLVFLDFVENTTLKIGNELPVGHNVSVRTDDLKLEITAVDPVNFTGYVYVPELSVENKELVQLSPRIFKNVSLVTKKVAITTMFIDTLPAMRKTKGPFRDIGKVFTISLDVHLEFPLENTVTYTLKVPENNFSNYKCVFWNSTDWDTTGCRVTNVSGALVECRCNHMTSFSLLMQVTDYDIAEVHAYILSVISYIGCSISIMGCVLLMLTYLMCGRLLKVSRNVIHMNLALAITISNGLFISADAVHMYKTLCLTVSISMLYSYLASFFWMLVEGIHVYLMIVKVFKSPNMMKVYIIIGWIIPAVIVAIAGLKFHVNFTRDDFCWISTEGNVIWVFVGPVLFIVAINGIILVTALSASYKMAIAENDFLKLQQIARLTMLLMPIFGLTWVFGLLAINKQLIIFQYVFTIINSLQGLYIFVCYCLLNNEVKQEFERIRRKYQYGSGPSASSADSNYSVYDQLFTRRLKSVVSVDSSNNMVKLTRYDSKLNRYDSVKTESTRASSTYSDSLAKRLNKNYSIELINLNDANHTSCGNNDTQSLSSSTMCPEEHDYGLKLNFEDVPLTNGRYTSNDFVNGSCTYDTFKAKR